MYHRKKYIWTSKLCIPFSVVRSLTVSLSSSATILKQAWQVPLHTTAYSCKIEMIALKLHRNVQCGAYPDGCAFLLRVRTDFF